MKNADNRGPNGVGAAVVGTGWGCLTHVPSLRAAGFDVETLVGTNEERTRSRAALSQIARHTTDLDSVLDDPSIDVIVVATPPATHVSIVLKAVEAGKHVFCEKPFATNLEDAVRMRDAAGQHGVINVVGHEFRWQPHSLAMAAAIRAGAIGDPTLVTHVRMSGALASPTATAPEWFESNREFGGWTNAEVQHVIDEVRTTVGEIVSVTALEGQCTPHRWASADTFVVQFTTAEGAMGMIQSSVGTNGPRINMQRVVGTNGTIWIGDDETVTLDDGSGERRLEPPSWISSLAGARPLRGDGVTQSVASANSLSAALSGASRFLAPTSLLHRAFRDRILDFEPESRPSFPTFTDGAINTAVHSAIRRSIENGQTQDVPTEDSLGRSVAAHPPSEGDPGP